MVKLKRFQPFVNLAETVAVTTRLCRSPAVAGRAPPEAPKSATSVYMYVNALPGQIA
jgi:hypothetical protein